MMNLYSLITHPIFHITRIFLITLSILVCIGSCTTEPLEELPIDTNLQGAWVANSPYKWDHDGDPYFSEWCIVFSDSADMEMKETAGQFADNRFRDIMHAFGHQNKDDFLFPHENDRIHIYLNMNHEERIAAAYWGTVIITLRAYRIDTTFYDYLFRHELTHAFEYLIEGTPELGTDVWFREGIAIYMGGGRNYITDTTGLNNWISANSGFPNGGNPISIHQWEDFPEASDIPGYYTVFEVVMEYILDPEGLGKSLTDLHKLFYDIRAGIQFPQAFENRFGISLADFETGIFGNLKEFIGN